MDAYGFSDFGLPVDSLGHDLGGYTTDSVIAAGAQSWLRNTGRPMADDGKPWALFVSLINPHDIMYFNTDKPGEQVQDTGKLLMHAARAPPQQTLYQQHWDSALPASLEQPMQEPGRPPRAHGEFLKAWGVHPGHDPARAGPLATLHRLLPEQHPVGGPSDVTAAGRTRRSRPARQHHRGLHLRPRRDGRGGARPARQGPVRLRGVHSPAHARPTSGRQRRTAPERTNQHIDLVPSLLALAGVPPANVDELAGRALPGKDFSAALSNPGNADVHSVRDSVLFTYSGLATNDSDAVKLFAEAKAAGQDPRQLMQANGFRPDLTKRGSLRTMFDGRYKFSRYFAPAQRNVPTNLDDLYRFNDVELYDLQSDPAEMTNLAANKGEHSDLVLSASTKLEAVIKSEIGVDDGREMPPQFGDIDWQIDRMDL